MKIGNLDISSFKVGSDDCKIYLGDTKLYPEEEPTPQTLQWVTFNNGDTIPSSLNIYGFSGVAENLYNTFGSVASEHFIFVVDGNDIIWTIANNVSEFCKEAKRVLKTEVISAICSEVGCDDYYNQGATVSGTIQLYIYA